MSHTHEQVQKYKTYCPIYHHISFGMLFRNYRRFEYSFYSKRLSDFTAQELSRIMQTEVRIGNIDLGLLNRVIIQNVYLEDKSGKELLKINRLSAKMELSSLLHGKIRISSVQLFGLNAHLNRPTPDSKTNFQFVLDAFASKDTIKKNQPSICVLIPY